MERKQRQTKQVANSTRETKSCSIRKQRSRQTFFGPP
jgi:hypothetical protein